MRRIGALLITVSILLAAAASAMAQDESLQVVDVTLTDRTVTLTVVAPAGLTDVEVHAGSFVVLVDGVQRLPAVERIPGDELEVVLLIDTSGSMAGGALDAAKAAAEVLVEGLPAGAKFAVVGFGSEPTVVSGFTTDKDATIAGIGSLAAVGDTALYKAVVTAAAKFDPTSQASRSIVLISDGGNTVAESSLGAAQAAVLATNATLYAVSLVTPESNLDDLQAMVADSGGTVTAVEDDAGLAVLYTTFAEILRNQYRLVFEGAGEGPVEAMIAAQVDGATVASTTVQVQMPRLPAVTPTPGQAPGGVDDLPTPVPALTPLRPVDAVVATDPTWLRWSATAALAIAIAIFSYLMLAPTTSRANPLRGMAPIVALPRAETAGGVRRLPDRLAGIADRLLARHGRGVRLSLLLEAAGLEIRNGEFAVLVGLLAGAGFLLGVLVSVAVGLVVAGLVIATSLGLVGVLVSRRRQAFADQLNGTLQMMAGSLRTGYSLAQVFTLIAQEAPSPTSDEFTRVVVEGRLGRDLIESCADLSRRMKSEDFEWVTNAIEITRDIGGDLAEVFDSLAGTIRARERIRRQISALSAEGRISAIILVFLPFPMFFWQLAVNREYTMLLFTTGVGRLIFFSAVSALVAGVIWIRRLIRLEF